MSADTHKFGYASKGTSVVLYRGPELRHHQYFTTTEWPGGIYSSPTFAGSRPGALSATCWAALVSIGENGYLEATGRILDAAAKIKAGIRDIPDLEVMGDPPFRSESLDVYRVMDAMTERGWSLNGLHKPPALHVCVTLRHAAGRGGAAALGPPRGRRGARRAGEGGRHGADLRNGRLAAGPGRSGRHAQGLHGPLVQALTKHGVKPSGAPAPRA